MKYFVNNIVFRLCRYTWWFSADLPCLHVHRWFMSSSAGAISLNTGVILTGTLMQWFTHYNPFFSVEATCRRRCFIESWLLHFTQMCSSNCLPRCPFLNQHHRFMLLAFGVSKYTLSICAEALTENPPIAPRDTEGKRTGKRLWRGNGKFCTWYHSGCPSAEASCGRTSMSNCSQR